MMRHQWHHPNRVHRRRRRKHCSLCSLSVRLDPIFGPVSCSTVGIQSRQMWECGEDIIEMSFSERDRKEAAATEEAVNECRLFRNGLQTIVASPPPSLHPGRADTALSYYLSSAAILRYLVLLLLLLLFWQVGMIWMPRFVWLSMMPRRVWSILLRL